LVLSAMKFRFLLIKVWLIRFMVGLVLEMLKFWILVA
jgi:hypothetical protein